MSNNILAETNDSASNIVIEKIEIENSEADICAELDDETLTDDELLQDNSEIEEPFFSFLDAPQEFISTGVEAFAQSLDEFFSEDKVFYNTSGTYLRLRGDAIRTEQGEVRYTGDVRLKLRLPHTKNKMKIVVESDADERPDDIATKTDSDATKPIEKNDYFTGVQASLGKEDSWQFKPSIGLRLSSTIEPYIRFRFKRKYQLDKWSAHWHETPYWFDSTGWGLDSHFELNRKISEDDLFRASTFARWTRELDYFELSQTFSMFHTLSKRRAISYYVGVYGISEPTVFASQYLIGATYRQNIHKDYLFLEVIPQIKYQKINNFDAEYSLILRLEILFKK